MKNKSIFRKLRNYILFLVIIIFCIFLVLVVKINDDKNGIKSKENEVKSKQKNVSEEYTFLPYINYMNISKKDIEYLIPKRCVQLKDEEKNILIGKSQKELENGYYDLKISVNEEVMILYINKLTIDEKCDSEKLVSDEYLNQIVNLIVEMLNVNEKSKQEILKNIKEQYIINRKNMYSNEESKEFRLEIEKYNMKFTNEENMLKIEVKNMR